MRRRRLLILLATVLAMAAVVFSPAAPASAASFRAHLKASGHNPTANKPWPITVTVRSASGKALRATAFYEFLFNGQVVSTQYPAPKGGTRHSPLAFTGKFSDTLVWPARSVGMPLTFRVVVAVKGSGKKNLDYKVRVKR
jgi:hypothetical protein